MIFDFLFKKGKKIGLALGSGGPRGLAHIGVIKTLVKNNIPIDYIAGTSAGALIGGIYCATKDIDLLEKIVNNFDSRNFLQIISDPFFKSGLLRGGKAIKFLEEIVGDIDIVDLLIPFNAVATNFYSGKPYVFSKGKLTESIRASSSIPFIFTPVAKDNTLLIDGASSQPVPTEVVRKMGADIVIGVSLDTHIKEEKSLKRPSVLEMAQVSLSIIRDNLAEENLNHADIKIRPNVQNISPFDLGKFINGEQIIIKGEIATEAILPVLKKLL
jgi:NTE family protein